MAHITNKKKRERERNSLKRVVNGFNTGTRNMGFESNQRRKEKGLIDSLKHDLY